MCYKSDQIVNYMDDIGACCKIFFYLSLIFVGLKLFTASSHHITRHGIWKFVCISYIYVQWRSKYLSRTITCTFSYGKYFTYSWLS